jgi:hypothetical protein
VRVQVMGCDAGLFLLVDIVDLKRVSAQEPLAHRDCAEILLGGRQMPTTRP